MLEIMIALLSAITHDLDHPGVNQAFLIATSNHLASLYKVAKTSQTLSSSHILYVFMLELTVFNGWSRRRITGYWVPLGYPVG